MRRAVRILGGVAIGLVLLTGLTPVVNLMTYWLAPARPLAPAGAIVVLASGGVTGRGRLSETSLRKLMDGIELYRDGLAPILVLSGSPSAGRRTEATVRTDIAKECGIPGDAIVSLSTARTTRDEAVAVGSLLAGRGVRSIILVTDAAAMARSMGAFQRVGFEVIPSYGMPVLDWGGGPDARLLLMHEVTLELAARLYYKLAGYL